MTHETVDTTDFLISSMLQYYKDRKESELERLILEWLKGTLPFGKDIESVKYDIEHKKMEISCKDMDKERSAMIFKAIERIKNAFVTDL